MRCPRCGRAQTGQVGSHEYYCWNCCVEFHETPGGWRLFEVDEEGGLTEMADDGAGRSTTQGPKTPDEVPA